MIGHARNWSALMSYERFLNELPPIEDWGERIYTRPELRYPDELNAAAELLDRNIAEGRGSRPGNAPLSKYANSGCGVARNIKDRRRGSHDHDHAPKPRDQLPRE